MLHEEQQMISTAIDVRERTQVLIMNIPRLRLHNLCANDVNRGLATSAIFIRVSREKVGEHYTGLDMLLI
jgi:hypothetical protein